MSQLTEKQLVALLTANRCDWKPIPGHGKGCIQAKGAAIRVTLAPDADGLFDKYEALRFIAQDEELSGWAAR